MTSYKDSIFSTPNFTDIGKWQYLLSVSLFPNTPFLYQEPTSSISSRNQGIRPPTFLTSLVRIVMTTQNAHFIIILSFMYTFQQKYHVPHFHVKISTIMSF